MPNKPKSALQIKLLEIGQEYNIDYAMGDPEQAMLEAYQLGAANARCECASALEHAKKVDRLEVSDLAPSADMDAFDAAAPQPEQQSTLLITPCKHEIVDCRACKGTFVNAIHLAQPEQQDRELCNKLAQEISEICLRTYGPRHDPLVATFSNSMCSDMLMGFAASIRRAEREEGRDDVLVGLADAATEMGVEGFTWDVSKNEESANNLFAALQRAERERVLRPLLDYAQKQRRDCEMAINEDAASSKHRNRGSKRERQITYTKGASTAYEDIIRHAAALSQPPEGDAK
jgi:hypothetical protein